MAAIKKFRPAVLLFSMVLVASAAWGQEQCYYIDKRGVMTLTNSLQAVPPEYRAKTKCLIDTKKDNSVVLARPEELTLGASVGRDVITTSIGTISIRWARSVEKLFGRTPMRALAEAAQASSRALRQGGFPPSITNLRKEWSVVIMDEKLPEAEIPAELISRCHPGWFTPPGNIFIVGQRVARGCQSGELKVDRAVSDGQLAQVLIHEIGHGIEFELQAGSMTPDLVRAEGFATWFEHYAGEFSSVINQNQKREELFYDARRGVLQGGLDNFVGTSEGYAAASMIFTAIKNRRGVGGVMAVYRRMNEDRMPFFEAIREEIGWDQKRLSKEVAQILQE